MRPVLNFTCALFSPFRSRVPLIGFLFILVIFLGDCLVSQPSFLFGTSTGNSAYQDTYAIGTVLTFVVAVGSGCYRVLQATSKLVPTWEFMLIGGLTSLAIGFLCPVMGLPSNLFDWTYFAANFWKLIAISVASLSSALLLLIAVKITGPTLSDMQRQASFLSSFWVVFRTLLNASTMSQTIPDIHESRLLTDFSTDRGNVILTVCFLEK